MAKPIHLVQSRVDGRSVHPGVVLAEQYEIECARRKGVTARPPQEPASSEAIEGDEPRMPRRGWHRLSTPEYRDAKRREAIISVLRREDLDDYDIPRETGNFP